MSIDLFFPKTPNPAPVAFSTQHYLEMIAYEKVKEERRQLLEEVGGNVTKKELDECLPLPPRPYIKPKSKYDVSYIRSRAKLATGLNLLEADLVSLCKTAEMLFRKMRIDYVNADDTLTAKTKALKIAAVEELDRRLMEAVQQKINPNVDWDTVYDSINNGVKVQSYDSSNSKSIVRPWG